MKIKDGFKIRTICNEHIVVAEGIEQVNFNKMVYLNSSAAYLWESVAGKDFTVKDLSDLLLGKYEVEEAVALQDAAKIANSWMDAGLLDE